MVISPFRIVLFLYCISVSGILRAVDGELSQTKALSLHSTGWKPAVRVIPNLIAMMADMRILLVAPKNHEIVSLYSCEEGDGPRDCHPHTNAKQSDHSNSLQFVDSAFFVAFLPPPPSSSWMQKPSFDVIVNVVCNDKNSRSFTRRVFELLFPSALVPDGYYVMVYETQADLWWTSLVVCCCPTSFLKIRYSLFIM